MTSISQVEQDKGTEPFDTDLWAQQLDLQWEKYFEQCEPPTGDKVSQVDMSDQTHPKLIFIRESFSPMEKQNLISLIREYINVFTWSYVDMPSLEPQVAMHYLHIKLNARSVKQQQWRFWLDIMKAIETEVLKLIECGFIREEVHPDWVANIVHILKKNEKIRVCINFRELNATYPKDEFPLSITESWLTTKRLRDNNQIKMYSNDEKHTSFRTSLGVILLYGDAIRLEEHRCNPTNMLWA